MAAWTRFARYRISGLLLAAFALAACGSKDGGVTLPPQPPPAPPPPPPPPPPPVVASVAMSPVYQAGSIGQSVTITATPKDSAGNTMTSSVSWFTSDPAVATVTSNGSVQIKGVGVAVITATSDGVSALAAVGSALPGNTNPVDHVFVVVEENTEYGSSIGSPQMPYFNALATQYGLATQYFGAAHPSLPNYFSMTIGNTENAVNSFADTVTDDNVVRELVSAGKSWRSYAEGLPSVGYLGGDNGSYIKHHNPFTDFTDVINDTTQRKNLVPFTQLAADMSAGTLPNYAMIVPNVCSDGHNCSLAVLDQWLRQYIGPLLRNAQFQQSGLLIVTFDEGSTNQGTGGHIATVVVGPRARRAFQSATTFSHPSLARFV
ncbi:MAG TPA: alkaline phosphatase family protein, partial [Gemmatimonadales bacterium]